MAGQLTIFLLFCGFFGTITMTSSTKTEEEREEAEAVLGVHVQTLPEPLWYNALVPILFEIPLPMWTESELIIKWPSGYGSDCIENDRFVENWATASCPVDFHLNKIVKRAHENMFPWMNLMPNLDEKPTIEDFECDDISPHFKSFVMTEEEKVKYLAAIRRCPPREFLHVNITDINSVREVDAEIYDTMLGRFTEEFSSPTKYRVTGFVKYPMTVNAHLGVQMALLAEYYEVSRTFSDALTICANYKLPPNVVNKKDLNTALEEVKRIFSRKNYDLSLPQADLDAYYRKDLTDCILTTKNTMIVRLLVPLRKLDYPLHLFRLVPMEFLRTVKHNNQSEICHFGSGTTHYIKDDNFEHFFQTDCESYEFCKVPDITKRIKVNSCVQYLLLGDKEKVLQHCNLFCEHAPKKTLPVFRQIDKDRYVITGKSADMEIFVSCGNKPFKVVTPPDDFGALEVILPCNCQIVYKGETLYSYGDCDNNVVSYKTIIPHQWDGFDYSADDFNGSLEMEMIQEEEEADAFGDMMFYMNVQFTILSVIIILIIFANIAMCYIIIGIMQRLHKIPGLHQSINNCGRIGSLCPNSSVLNGEVRHEQL